MILDLRTQLLYSDYLFGFLLNVQLSGIKSESLLLLQHIKNIILLIVKLLIDLVSIDLLLKKLFVVTLK